MEKMLFDLKGNWKKNIWLNKYAKPLLEDTEGKNPLLNIELMGEWLKLLHKTFGVDYSWGGWMEDREEMWEGTYLPKFCRFHLGIDFWVPVHTSVYLPKDGTLVYSRHDPDQEGGWGGQVIYKIGDLYYIFGHLKNVHTNLKDYKAGDFVGWVAEPEINGGWWPHLHLQCMKELDVNVDGYGRYDFSQPNTHEKFPDPSRVLK